MLTRQVQLQVIVDWMHDAEFERDYDVDEFTGPLQKAWQAVKFAPYQDGQPDLFRQICLAKLKDVLKTPEELALLGRILSGTPSSEIHYRNLHEIGESLVPVRWLWENWLPIGMLSMLAARPGTGKSLVALDLMRKIIAGEAWPDGCPQPCPGADCIYVDAENVPAILNQRAVQWEQWGMDRRKIWPLLADEDDILVSLASPKYADRLADMCHRIKPALVVVDSLRDILPAGESAVEDVRSVLALLSAISVESNCAVTVIHHLRKGPQSGQMALFDSIDLDQVSGSGYIGGRARVVLGLTKVQTGAALDKNGPRKLEVIKTNLGVYPKDIGVTFEQVPPDGLRLVYGQPPKRYEDRSEAELCADWLLSHLTDAGEPVTPREVTTEAEAQGYSRSTLYRARELLGAKVVETGERRSRSKRWALAGSCNEICEEAE